MFQAFSGCEEVGFQNSTAVFTDAPNIDAVALTETDFPGIISFNCKSRAGFTIAVWPLKLSL